MLKFMPYSNLLQDKRAYAIMQLRDRYEGTYADIAQKYGITTERASQLYYRSKKKQINLYINQIAFSLGHEDIQQIRKVYDDALECYGNKEYACAYLEKKYRAILEKYRCGEPGIPLRFIQNMPPFQPALNRQMTARVVAMREEEKVTFKKIADELGITQAKARRIYSGFYHQKTLEILTAKAKAAKNEAERQAVWIKCFSGHKNAKNRYEELIKGEP